MFCVPSPSTRPSYHVTSLRTYHPPHRPISNKQIPLPVSVPCEPLQKKMVEDAMKQLSNGVSLVTFAEGTRSKDGRLQTFKKGAFRISKAVRSHIPIRL